MYRFFKTEEYAAWYNCEPLQAKLQVEKRLSHIRDFGHFGDHKQVSEYVWELKWKNGRRLYYAYLEELNLLLLLGGNKNGQSQDIRKAQKILQRYQDSEPKKRSKN